MAENLNLSIIVPVYNESKRINKLLEILNYFNKQNYKFEVIVVNDGSKDETLNQIKNINNKNLKIVSYKANKGKGYAIKTGVSVAKGNYILFTDVDLSTPLDQIEKFIPFFNKKDIIIGTRKNNKALLLKRQPIIREYLGKAFTFLSQKTLSVAVSDFTCGFKCFSKKAAQDIFPKMQINRWGFDSEILYIAKIKDYDIHEVPVTWKNDSQTKVKFPQDIINSLKELIQIRLNGLQNKYN